MGEYTVHRVRVTSKVDVCEKKLTLSSIREIIEICRDFEILLDWVILKFIEAFTIFSFRFEKFFLPL